MRRRRDQCQVAPDGLTDLDDLKAKLTNEVAAVMVTNPNTVGKFDAHVVEMAELVHEAGAFLYLDGANMNAILGIARPGDFGVDVMHYNTHKTFSTPHGCGGPGAGPIAVRKELAPYLPVPQVDQERRWLSLGTLDRPKSIGKVRSFWGQFNVLVRAYTYIRACGPEGLRNVSRNGRALLPTTSPSESRTPIHSLRPPGRRADGHQSLCPRVHLPSRAR